MSYTATSITMISSFSILKQKRKQELLKVAFLELYFVCLLFVLSRNAERHNELHCPNVFLFVIRLLFHDILMKGCL